VDPRFVTCLMIHRPRNGARPHPSPA
jgi:hypothetical protein